MNEQIQELIKQATVEVRSHGAFGEPERYTKLDPEKFAQLIVRECAEVAANVVAEHEGVDFGLVEACYKHFGVRE
jgi:hypothetical protein